MDKLNLIISGIIMKDGQKRACVYFSDDDRYAEGYIPDCRITSQKGFTEEEIRQLEVYLHNNLDMLKKQASEVNLLRGFAK